LVWSKPKYLNLDPEPDPDIFESQVGSTYGSVTYSFGSTTLTLSVIAFKRFKTSDFVKLMTAWNSQNFWKILSTANMVVNDLMILHMALSKFFNDWL
jgi:hypothetical protein